MVRRIALTLPDVVEERHYTGAPVFRVHGVFLAGIAQHESAEPRSIVLRSPLDQRDLLIEDAPDTYYTTYFYRPYPLVLVRLAKVNRDALRDLLAASYRLTMEKTRREDRTAIGELGNW